MRYPLVSSVSRLLIENTGKGINPGRNKTRLFIVLLLTVFLLQSGGTTLAQSDSSKTYKITKHDEGDGVIRWEARSIGTSRRPRFFDVFSELTALKLPDDPDQLPFGRSIAFLVGVSLYANLDPLPGAEQSVQRLRDYLLSDGGFDVVYELSDFDSLPNVKAKPSLVKDYMLNRFVTQLNRSDRLLFYFAGHGTDRNATTGYLLFRNAARDKFDESYLSTNDIREWSQAIPARHILFLLDACSAGFGFGLAPQGSDLGVLTALGESRSREIITAGTGKQETFDVESPPGTYITAFGAALLSALRQSTANGDFKSLITTDRLFSDLSVHELAFANTYAVSLKPGRYPIQSEGQFVFPNALAKGSLTPGYLATAFHATNDSSGSDLSALGSMLQFRSASQDQISRDPILAYSLAASAYRLRPDTTNRRLILSALSKVQLYYRYQLDGFVIEHVRIPLILLSKRNPEDGGKSFAVFDTRTSETQLVVIKADHAWVIPMAKGWRILGREWSSLDTRPKLQLWDAEGKPVGGPVEQGDVGFPAFQNPSSVRIPLYGESKMLLWDLINDRRQTIARNRTDDPGAYFENIYGPMDTRANGDSAVHYKRGLVLTDTDDNYKAETYTAVDFDPAFSSATWSPDGEFLALRYSEQQRLGIWNPVAKSFVWLDPQRWVVDSYAWSSAGHTLAFAGRHENETDVTVEVVDANAPGTSRRVIYKGSVPIRCIAFLPSDQQLVFGDRDKSIYSVEVASGRLLSVGYQEGTTRLYAFGGAFYSSSADRFRVWSTNAAPAAKWTFESFGERKYTGHAAADGRYKWLAVPFRDGTTKAGVEVRDVSSGRKRDLDVPDPESINLLFSDDDRWLILETFKNVRVYSTDTWSYYDFTLQLEDKQFLKLSVESGRLHAYAVGKGSLGTGTDDYDYSVDLNGSKPSQLVRVPNKKSEASQRDPVPAGSETSVLKDDAEAWDSAKLYKYQGAGLLSVNSTWAYFIKCRDEPLLARNCDVQFVPKDLEKLMSLYESLLWKPSADDLRLHLSN